MSKWFNQYVAQETAGLPSRNFSLWYSQIFADSRHWNQQWRTLTCVKSPFLLCVPLRDLCPIAGHRLLHVSKIVSNASIRLMYLNLMNAEPSPDSICSKRPLHEVKALCAFVCCSPPFLVPNFASSGSTSDEEQTGISCSLLRSIKQRSAMMMKAMLGQKERLRKAGAGFPGSSLLVAGIDQASG